MRKIRVFFGKVGEPRTSEAIAEGHLVRTLMQDDLRFYVHRKVSSNGVVVPWRSWNVTEFISGIAIVTESRSRAKAIADAAKKIESVGVDTVWERVLLAVEMNGPANMDEKAKAVLTVRALAK